MKDRPIIFSAPMVRALLREVEVPGTGKTQTRRLAWGKKYECPECNGLGVIPEIHDGGAEPPCGHCNSSGTLFKPTVWQKAKPGDRLYVRETFKQAFKPAGKNTGIIYRADYGHRPDLIAYEDTAGWGWKPPIHMFRKHSRLTLVVTAVRMERLHDISEEDARAEGVEKRRNGHDGWEPSYGFRTGFVYIWNSIHGPDAWAANPDIVVPTFTVHQTNINQMEITQ